MLPGCNSYELEVLAVIEAVKKFRVYLHGMKFKIVTDCAAFSQTMKKREISAKTWRWAEMLENSIILLSIDQAPV